MGLTGFIALDGFKASLDETIAQRSKTLLGADFGLSARRPILDSEVKAVTEKVNLQKQSKMIEVFSMVKAHNDRSRLVQIRAIEGNYPFYGELELKKDSGFSTIETEPNVWVHPEVLGQLNAKVGDQVKIGVKNFKIIDVVESDTASGFTTSVAPRVYMSLGSLNKTELIQAGSLAWHTRLFKIPELSDKKLEQLREDVFSEVESAELQVFTHKKASEQLAGLVSRLNDFLGLTSLVALFLAAIGTFFLIRSYFSLKVDQVAILVSLGLSSTQAFLFYLSQVFILALVSSVSAGLMSLLVVPVLGDLLKNLLPFSVNFFIKPETFLLGAVVGILGSVFICLSLIVKFRKTKPQRLLSLQSDLLFSKSDLFKLALFTLPAFGLFLALSVFLANSYKVGMLFTVLFLGSGLFLALISWLIFKEYKTKSLSLNWALKDLCRNKATTAVCFVSIGVGVLLLNLIPQVQKTIEKEIISPDQSKLPTYFMFDIQEEQVAPLKTIIQKENATLKNISPTVRAKLIKVNGEGFSKTINGNKDKKALTREEEREARFRNRGFNLSYRDELDESEKIVEGRPFSGRYEEDFESESFAPAEISMEEKFAERLGFKIGDLLEFEIDGVPITGKVINLRSVKWSSFQPNFFVQFQPGSLDLAPKNFVATVKVLGFDQKVKLQNEIVEALPNVSMVDVSRVVRRLNAIMKQMSWALQFMSILCVIAGFVVIYSIANHQASLKKWEVGLLKALGAPFDLIRNQFLWQFSLISLGACLVGVLISFFASFVISVYLFESSWTLYLLTPAVTVLVTILLTVLVTMVAIRKTLNAKTVDTLF